eukprot:350389-Chlamydomonas_euryale.AAC.1
MRWPTCRGFGARRGVPVPLLGTLEPPPLGRPWSQQTGFVSEPGTQHALVLHRSCAQHAGDIDASARQGTE